MARDREANRAAGSLLREVREAAGLTLGDISQRSRVAVAMLAAAESGSGVSQRVLESYVQVVPAFPLRRFAEAVEPVIPMPPEAPASLHEQIITLLDAERCARALGDTLAATALGISDEVLRARRIRVQQLGLLEGRIELGDQADSSPDGAEQTDEATAEESSEFAPAESTEGEAAAPASEAPQRQRRRRLSFKGKREACLERYIEIREQLGTNPNSAWLQEHDHALYMRIYRLYGGFRNFLRVHKLTPDPLDRYREHERTLGYPPAHVWVMRNDPPLYREILRTYGGFTAFIEQYEIVPKKERR